MTKTLILIVLSILSSCGKNQSPVQGDPHQKQIEANFSFFESNKKLIPAKLNSPYSKAILKCALKKDGRGCTPKNVPLLGMRDEELNSDYILKNTIVSHNFLAKNFKEYLNSIHNKYLFALFSSVSGIVITDEISSSFYYSPTGMIYINASYLWKSHEEFTILKFKKDKRFSRDERKKISTDVDFVKNNKIIYFESHKKERTLENLQPNLSRLLFHELTHANDVYPSNQFYSLNKTKSYLKLRTARYESKELVSRQMVYPLTIKAWEYAIFFVDNELIHPNSHIFTKKDFMDDFVPNIAMVFYSYTTNREHLAMMMENYFMLFTEHFETCNYAYYRPNNNKSELFWFQKNRILQPNILLEAKNAIKLMLPNTLASELTSINTEFSLETVSDINPEGKQPTCRSY